MRRDGWNSALWAAVILLAAAPSFVQYLSNRDGVNFGFYHDDGLYYVTAKSLAQSGAFRLESFPGEPWSTKFPPLWPAYLSLAWRLQPQFPENLRVAYALAWLVVPAVLVMAAALLRRMGFSTPRVISALMLMGLSPATVLLGNSLMSELFFGVMLYGALWLAEGTRTGRGALLAGFVGGMAFLARSAGLPLLVSAPLVFCLRKQFRLGLFFVCGMLPLVAAWMSWSAAHQLPPSGDANLAFYSGYFDQIRANVDGSMLGAMLYQNAGSLFAAAGKLLIFNLADTFWSNYASQLLGLVAAGAVLMDERRRGFSHFGVYVAGMFAMLVTWCYPPTERFLWPAFPLLATGMLAFLENTTATLRKAVREKKAAERAIAIAGLAIVAGVALTWLIETRNALLEVVPQSVRRYRAMLPAKRAAYAWLREHSQPADLISAPADPSVYLYTGRKALGTHMPMKLFYGGDRRMAVEYFASRPWPASWPQPSFLMLTPDSYEADLTPDEVAQVAAQFESDPRLKREFANRGVVIYRILN